MQPKGPEKSAPPTPPRRETTRREVVSAASFATRLGYCFDDLELLTEALTHRSALTPPAASQGALASGKLPRCNERLEFLGDSVLGLCISRRLMEQGAQLNEGQLSRMRAALVNEKSLADLARKLGIGAVVRVGKGERKTGGVERDALLADVLEAVIGAVFVDGGYAAADALVGHLFAGALAMDMQALAQTDYKTELQELTQEVYKKTPNYLVSAATGPDHKKQFEVMVKIGEKELGRGRGASKKRASQAAASAALAALAAQENGAELPELDTKAKEKGDGAIARRLSKRST